MLRCASYGLHKCMYSPSCALHYAEHTQKCVCSERIRTLCARSVPVIGSMQLECDTIGNGIRIYALNEHVMCVNAFFVLCDDQIICRYNIIYAKLHAYTFGTRLCCRSNFVLLCVCTECIFGARKIGVCLFNERRRRRRRYIIMKSFLCNAVGCSCIEWHICVRVYVFFFSRLIVAFIRNCPRQLQAIDRKSTLGLFWRQFDDDVCVDEYVGKYFRKL